MTACFGAAVRIAPLAAALLALAALSGCDDATQTPPATGTAAATTPAAPVAARTAPVATIPTDTGDTGQTGTALVNDPSAPANTPLCGMAAQESNTLSRQLLSRQYAEAGQCSTYACYDAATATYIGADGYRHVCR